ncbi:ATP-binding protein [Kordiimonas sp.]|uniref:hybrid sensor histidine kinase/response regulator n=1 Tax=Kordiimonas sp. TaxID=1970157 RepID=UPI003A8D5752
MRYFRAIIDDIPIRYFVPLGFFLAAFVTVMVYFFIARPEADQRAFELSKQEFERTLADMQGRYNLLLGRGDTFGVTQDMFLTADDPAIMAILILNADNTVRYAHNASLQGLTLSELPFTVHPAQIRRTTLTGQILTHSDTRQNTLTGYAGLGFLEGGAMTQNVLVIVLSSAQLASEIDAVALRLVAIMGATLFLLALFVMLLTWVKIDRRLKRLLNASKALALDRGDLDVWVKGQDEFGQIASQLETTSKLLMDRHAALIAATKAAEAANDAKSDFLSNMSHEIRTPMNGVIGGLNLLMSSKNEEERNELLQASLSSAHMLLNIINDILDFSKLEAGKLEVHKAPFLLARTLKDIQILMRSLASEKRNTIVLDVPDDCDTWLVGDEVRLRQVINNLVSNALKFTEEGTVTLHVRLERAEGGATLEVRVEDTGVGISEADLERLFKRFSQLDNVREKKAGGTGLGLAISQQLIELMGGQIGVESKLGQGSCFWFKLPVELKETGASQVPMEGKAEPRDSGALSILLVEDMPINQMLIGKMLRMLGHSFTLVQDGVEALEAVERAEDGKFDLILMDNQMPRMNGTEATGKIRERSDAKAVIPIIALTADAMVEQREAFFRAGVNGFVSKPIEIDKLRFEISSVLQGNT